MSGRPRASRPSSARRSVAARAGVLRPAHRRPRRLPPARGRSSRTGGPVRSSRRAGGSCRADIGARAGSARSATACRARPSPPRERAVPVVPTRAGGAVLPARGRSSRAGGSCGIEPGARAGSARSRSGARRAHRAGRSRRPDDPGVTDEARSRGGPDRRHHAPDGRRAAAPPRTSRPSVGQTAAAAACSVSRCSWSVCTHATPRPATSCSRGSIGRHCCWRPSSRSW